MKGPTVAESLRTSSPWRPLTRTTLVALLVIGVVATQASAAQRITIANDGILIAEPGSVLDIAEVDVDPSQVGMRCTVEVISQNQASVHLGNDLLVTTAGVVTVIEDVEAEPDASVDRSVDLLIGDTIVFQLRMGPDWVSSLGFELSLNCDEAEPVSVPVSNPDCSNDADATTGNGSSSDDNSSSGDQSGNDCTPSSETDVPAGVPLPGVNPTAVPLPPTTTCGEGSVGGSTDAGSNDADSDCQTGSTVPATTAPPTTSPTTAAPAPSAPASTGDANSSSTSTPASAGPEVLGLVVERLPASPAAPAIAAAPSYNG